MTGLSQSVFFFHFFLLPEIPLFSMRDYGIYGGIESNVST